MIVVIGEALIDLIEQRDSRDGYQAVVGGANANVAIALARAGVKQQFLARISTDAFGNKIFDRLQDNGVGLDHIVRTNEPSTLAIASIGESGGASYSFYLEGTADWGWSPEELPGLELLKSLQVTALQFGCLTMAMPPGNAVIEQWATKFFEQELLTISHDINVRPALGFDAGKERERVERVNSISHLVKASDDDIYWLYALEQGSSVDEVAWRWIGDSPRIVFVTRGGDGVSIYRSSGKRLDVPSRKVSVKDTVGAGDTFCANTLAQLERASALGLNPFEKLAALSDEELVEMARISGIAASMACEKTGAEPPRHQELQALLAELESTS